MAIIKNPLTDYHTIPPPKPVRRLVQWSLDARRAAVFFRRAKAGVLIGSGAPNTREHSEMTLYRKELEKKKEGAIEIAPNVAQHSKFVVNKQNKSLEDYVAIIDLDAGGLDKQYEVIKLPFIPRELAYNCESAFAAIKPMGRNNPFYHFTGAEDKLEFEIDWHAFDWGRREVIENCRKIESLTKADAYNNGPHRVMLKWGKENILFSDHVFVVLAAPYKMTQFNKGNIGPTGVVESTHMLPVQAYQKVILGRITSKNLSKVDIEFVNYAPPTRLYQLPTNEGLGTSLII